MKLSHYDLESVFDLEPSSPNVFVVEDERLFLRYYKELSGQINGDDGNFCLSDGDKNVPLSKYAVLTDNYLSIDVNSRKIITRLYQRLKTDTEENFYPELSNLMQDWGILFEKLNSESCCPIDYDDEDVINSLFKSFNVKVYNEADSLSEQILSYMMASNELLGISIFFFVNLKTVLTESDLMSFYKECAINAYSVFLMENTYKSKISSERVLLIDRDLCEIFM